MTVITVILPQPSLPPHSNLKLLWLANILNEVFVADGGVGTDLERLWRVFVVDNDGSDVVHVAQVVHLRWEVDISRDKDHCRGRWEGTGKLAQAVSQFVISSILGNGTDVDQSYLVAIYASKFSGQNAWNKVPTKQNMWIYVGM